MKKNLKAQNIPVLEYGIVYREGQYLPELDGVREIAILLVFLFHFTRMVPATKVDIAFKVLADTGWTGVDLFFVLSGFLITGILYETKNHHFFFRNFFGRRILRIFPLSYGFLCLAFLVVPLFYCNDNISTLLTIKWWYVTYTNNFMIWLKDWEAAPYTTHL